jgi:hypothetical protein
MAARKSIDGSLRNSEDGLSIVVRLCEIVSASEYLRSLIAASEHAMRFRVFADMRLVRSLSGELIRKMG